MHRFPDRTFMCRLNLKMAKQSQCDRHHRETPPEEMRNLIPMDARAITPPIFPRSDQRVRYQPANNQGVLLHGKNIKYESPLNASGVSAGTSQAECRWMIAMLRSLLVLLISFAATLKVERGERDRTLGHLQKRL
jgi:hypothetical protein